MANVTLNGIDKSFGAVRVVRNVSLEIEDGSFVVLVGPSGCGKSTLLRMIAGLETISGGTVEIGGETVNHKPPKDRNIAMVFQTYALYPHMTVEGNMGFALEMQNVEKAERHKRIMPASEMLGMDTLLGRFPKQLSGGQRQRVAMGRAIVRDPKVFLFDEPLSNLDAKLRVQMRREIKSMHQRLRTTTIYVTHDQIEAMTMADKIVVLRDGVVEQVGAPMELYDRPGNRFVAGFIGSPQMNFFDAVAADGVATLQGGETIALPERVKASGPVVVGIRPENFEIGGDTGLPLKVGLVEPTGGEILVNGTIGDQDATVVLRDVPMPSLGQTLWLRVAPERLHLFDAETQARIEI